MSVTYFILISIILKVSGVVLSDGPSLSQFDENIHEVSLCEDKISVELSVLKTEIHHRLDALEKNIPDNLEDIMNRKLRALESKISDRLEEYLDQKFYKLDKRMLDRLEEYKNEQLDALMKNNKEKFGENIENKLDALEKNITDKLHSNIFNISRNFVALEKRVSNLDENIKCKLNTPTYETSEKNMNDINRKLDTIEKNILNIDNNTTYYKVDQLEKNIHVFEGSLNSKWDTFKKMTLDVEENIKRKITDLAQKNPLKLEKNINYTWDVVKKIMDLKNITCNRDMSAKTFDQIEYNVDHKLDEMLKKMSKLEEILNLKFDLLQNLENAGINKSSKNLRCKEHVVRGYNFEPLYRIDNESLNHVPLQKTVADGVTYFEMHIAIKAARDGLILLSPVLDPGLNDSVCEIGIGTNGNQQTVLRLNKRSNLYTYKDTPNILSSTQYAAFYIKISDGNLTFGKEGSSSPLLSYSDVHLNAIKYFGFASWNSLEAKFLYDCPTTL